MKENLERLDNERMEYYRHVYRNSKRWNKESLIGKHIIVYVEQGYGDAIQMARYFKYLRPARITLHCPVALCSLFSTMDVDATIPREEEELPDHDFHTLSLSLPFLVEDPGNSAYLFVEPMDLSSVPGKKIGIAWEGNPNYLKNLQRSCPLKHFKKLFSLGNVFSLQIQQNLPELANDCSDFELLGVEMGDFLKTAQLIQAMDVVVSVDTSVLHLAGALEKKSFGLLCCDHDKRWIVRKWYDSVEMWRQPTTNDWYSLFKNLPEIF